MVFISEVSFYLLVLVWIARAVFLVFTCSFLAVLGIRLMDVLIPKIPKRELVGEHPISVGLFIAGLFIFMGLVIHGVLTTPAALGGPILEVIFDVRRLCVMTICFFVSVLLGVAMFYIADKLTPRIPFMNIEKDPIAVGVCVFSYLVFFGLIVHAVLAMPI
ncbi:MAG: hypothetical protein DRJ40_00065 [Thermoprotei archaeon]|nr:MAG: hypothetical protein DRJ40_00065 [Thermoprotei archaeon]